MAAEGVASLARASSSRPVGSVPLAGLLGRGGGGVAVVGVGVGGKGLVVEVALDQGAGVGDQELGGAGQDRLLDFPLALGGGLLERVQTLLEDEAFGVFLELIEQDEHLVPEFALDAGPDHGVEPGADGDLVDDLVAQRIQLGDEGNRIDPGPDDDGPFLVGFAGHDRKLVERLDVGGEQADEHKILIEIGLQLGAALTVGDRDDPLGTIRGEADLQRVAGEGTILGRGADEVEAGGHGRRLDADGDDLVAADHHAGERDRGAW